jgi:hypothetical protein
MLERNMLLPSFRLKVWDEEPIGIYRQLAVYVVASIPLQWTFLVTCLYNPPVS